MAKKIVIIGAGIAGLSSGCYARMNGYDAEIFESHSQPGGLCTSWKRGDYLFDGCIHWLTGSSPADSFYELWEELGVVQGTKMIDHDIFQKYSDTDGKEFIIYSNVDKLEEHMMSLSPADAANIKLLCGLARKFARFNFPQTKAFELMNLRDTISMILKFLPFARQFNYCNNLKVGDFAKRFNDPLLKESIPRIFGGPEISMIALIVTLALFHKRAGGYPLGGSLEFAKKIEKRFVDLGGIIHYKSPVEKVVTEGKLTTGIILKGGKEITADYIVSASDLHKTLYELLDGKFINPLHAELLEKVPVFPTSVQVSFGVRMKLPDEAGALTNFHKMPEPFLIGNEQHQWLREHNYSYDPAMAPEGSTAVTSLFSIKDFSYWEKLYSDKQAYKAVKSKILDTVSGQFEKIYPGFRSAIEESDVATPMTYVKYTGNRNGSYMTWSLVGKNAKKFQVIPKQVPGLDNFWLAGMWVMAPGGVPTGAKTGRDVVQIICRKEKKRFRTDKIIRSI
jgi:phytoene dehydrogenase-like protein